MAGSKTAYLSQAVLDHCLGGTPFVPPADIWFVVSMSPFDSSATGDACAELTAADYARLEAVNDDTTWAPASVGAPSLKSNLSDLVWAEATTDWGEPLSMYVADAATSGNLLYGADLAANDGVAIADIFKILAGTFVFSED